MSTKITLDNPTGDRQLILELERWVDNGEEIEVEDPELAKRLLQNPIWKGRKPSKTAEDKTSEASEGGNK